MFKKPIHLVALFGILFAILISIQVHFLINSYSLKKREIFAQVKSELSDLEDDVDIFDDDVAKDDDALDRFVKLENNIITDSTLRESYKVVADYIQPHVTHYLDSVFSPVGYHVEVYKEITSIFSHNLNKELIEKPILLYKSNGIIKNKEHLSSGKWETSTSSKHEDTNDISLNEEKYYAYTVKRISYFEITNLEKILFRELFLLIAISVILLIAILILFYRSYKNLLEQKRQIENLHDMVDNVAHELRTPVGTLKVVSKTLEKTNPSDIVQVLGRQVDRLEAILKPLTAESTTEVNRYFQQKYLDSYINDFAFANPEVSIRVDKIPNINLKIRQDDMETILSNLLGNSVKYGANHIDLQFAQEENLFSITVIDNGKGISKEDQPYIFDKFYRIQKDNIHETKGLGLGLYIVKKLIEKYKGKIEVESSLEQGTSFQISIPHD